MKYIILFLVLSGCTVPAQREIIIPVVIVPSAVAPSVPVTPQVEEIKEQKKVVRPILVAPCKGIQDSDIDKKLNIKLDCIEGVLVK